MESNLIIGMWTIAGAIALITPIALYIRETTDYKKFIKQQEARQAANSRKRFADKISIKV